jgi:hypothetical protein
MFFLYIANQVKPPHPLTLGLTPCICGQLLDPLRIHLFHYAHGGNRIASHDIVQDGFASIVKDVGFHVLQEQIHIFSLSSLQSFPRRWTNIVLLVDDIWTLADVVIVNLIRANLVSQAFFSCGVIVTMAT